MKTNNTTRITQQTKDKFIMDRFDELQAQIFLLQHYTDKDENSVIYYGLSGLEALAQNLYEVMILETIEQPQEANHD